MELLKDDYNFIKSLIAANNQRRDKDYDYNKSVFDAKTYVWKCALFSAA